MHSYIHKCKYTPQPSGVSRGKDWKGKEKGHPHGCPFLLWSKDICLGETQRIRHILCNTAMGGIAVIAVAVTAKEKLASTFFGVGVEPNHRFPLGITAKVEGGGVQLDAHAQGGGLLEQRGQPLALRQADHLAVHLRIAAADLLPQQMGQTDLVPRQGQIQHPLQFAQQGLGLARGGGGLRGGDGEVGAMEMADGDEQKIHLRQSLGANTHGAVQRHIHLGTKQKPHPLSRGQGQLFGDVRPVLGGVKIGAPAAGRHRHQLIPEVVGQSDGGHPLVQSILQDAGRSLVGVFGTHRAIGMDVQIVINNVAHKLTSRLDEVIIAQRREKCKNKPTGMPAGKKMRYFIKKS